MQTDGSADTAELTEVLQFMQLLWALVHQLEKVSKHMNQAIGVTGPQRLVLRVIGLFPGVSAGRLAAILHVHPSTLTGVLRRLSDQGLITRCADDIDRRRAVLHLTPKGLRVNSLRGGTVEAAVDRTLRTISDRDRGAARRVLTAIAAGLDQECR